MRNILIATSALAFAGAVGVGQASAADKMSIGISGYMNQWFGFTSIEEGGYKEGMKEADKNGDPMDKYTEREGAFDIRSNAEVHFSGSMKADNGLTFGVKVEFEANNSGVQADSDVTGYKSRGAVVDESFAWVSGEFGKLTIGAEDSAQSLMHTSVGNAGLDLGEVRMFFPENEAYYTANWQADNKRIVYMTPRISGVQFGVSYGPGGNENYGHQSDGDLANNDMDTWSVAVNMSQEFAGGNVSMSLGHIDKGTDNDATNFGVKISASGVTAGVAYLSDDNPDDAKDREMTVAGLMYADGPLSISGNYGINSKEMGDVSIAMLSVGYTLAPGVGLHSSLFTSESELTQVVKEMDSSGMPTMMADFEGTGLVMGIKLSF